MRIPVSGTELEIGGKVSILQTLRQDEVEVMGVVRIVGGAAKEKKAGSPVRTGQQGDSGWSFHDQESRPLKS